MQWTTLRISSATSIPELDKAEQKLGTSQTPTQKKALEYKKKILSAMSLDIDAGNTDIGSVWREPRVISYN